MSSKRPPSLTRLSSLDAFEGIYDIQILVNMTYLLRGPTRFLGEGRRQHLSTVLGNISVHKDTFLNVTLFFFSFDIPPLWFLRVWWRSTSSFSFENSFALKGFWSWTCLVNPKCQYYFVLYVRVCVCQLNVITDPTALISIWYLIGRFASSILKLLFNLF